MIRKTRSKKSMKRSLSNREELLDKFDAYVKAGRTSREASEKIDAPISSIYRWQRERKRGESQAAEDAIYRKVEKSISLLIDSECDDEFERLEAIFTLIIWNRWPKIQEDFDSAMMVCVVSYILGRHSAGSVRELPADIAQFLNKHLKLQILKKICSVESLDFPAFEIFNNHEHPYNEIDLIADVVWFLIAYEPNSKRQKAKASLGKAHYASQNGIFRFNSRNAPSVFRSKWQNYAPAAPFHYVERHHQGLELTLDPSHSSFSEEIGDLLSNTSRFRTYFGQCRHAVEMLCSRLDARALSTIRFPKFPADLAPVLIRPAALPRETDAILKGYAKIQNSFKDNEMEVD